MSIAGIRSNRGDGYQTMVAFDWALTVLSDPDCLWLEIDSITYPVDDVVIGKADDTVIAIQCKKNQTNFKAWSIADLSEELDKAASLLDSQKRTEVRFYSRGNFGDLAKLREHSSTQNDENSYRKSLSKDLQAVDADLTARLATSTHHLSSYEFLCRTKFVVSDEFDRMAELVRERLRNMMSNADAAFDALWRNLDQLGARMSGDSTSTIRHRLTKDDIKAIISKAGALLAPPMDIVEVRSAFASTSTIGRAWRREIANQRIPSPTVNELLTAIDEKKRTILLTGLPGSGKTCVMLALQDALEIRAQASSDIVPIFIQSREFADLVTAQDRHSQGLPEQWVEKAARLAEQAHVIVVLDSLDVLSIARDHRVLAYFLAQIDRLLLIPNVTVITSCRDFDRHYDRRIAERIWDCELKCQPLDWSTEISPLLDSLGIKTTSIDATTRELITNPRELALFIELAQHGKIFSVVTSQALAQRYLDTIVRANKALGDTALQAIESIASDMLKSRSLAVPHQRFGAPQEVLRLLYSLNVIQETHDGKLTFGHQTLLDVLVISGAVRSGVTLNTFLQELPPVPFVRPSIRSFVFQLAQGDRREFRKQIRTVLTGSTAFHIKRLVAESFAEQKPTDEDWPLICDLRKNHREVFQVIYGAKSLEWHHLWSKHLVPELRAVRDADEMTRHVYRTAQWINADPTGVLALWTEALSLDWLDSGSIAEQIGFRLSEIKPENIALTAPLADRLIDMPRTEHSSLGRFIARCVSSGVADDSLLWRYIAGGVCKDSLLEYRFDKKLRCNPHEFGDQEDKFLRVRMQQSTALLDLALESIENWSDIRISVFGEGRIHYRHGFLGETSYERVHSMRDAHYADSINMLLDAIEAAIIHHAKINSDWWINNRERLSSSHEGALLYFTVLACTASPEVNIDLIGQMLSDKNLLEFELSYELGALIQSAFIFLDVSIKDAVISHILKLWGDDPADEHDRPWISRRRATLIAAVPCHQRSLEAQETLEAYEEKYGTLIRQPDIRSRGGTVRAPFSYEVFLNVSDAGVLRLLLHYAGHDDSFDDCLIGGERQVAWQMREASSRNPTRFMDLLRNHWENIPECFRDDILDGIASYLTYIYGNLQADSNWKPIEEPNASMLARLILDELERHPTYWQNGRSAAKALEACSSVIYDMEDAGRLTLLASEFEGLDEKNPISGDNIGLIAIGINMIKGHAAEALMILATNLHERGNDLPILLVPILRNFASNKHPAIRSLILRRLPYLQSKAFDLGWNLFHLAMENAEGLWKIAENCLYYAYHNHFEVVRTLLQRLRREGCSKDLEVWGRISALATMDNKIEFQEYLQNLKALDTTEAWLGAATVWTNLENIQQHREHCFTGLNDGMSSGIIHAQAVAEQTGHLFHSESSAISVPMELIQRCFSVFKMDRDGEKKHHRLFGFHEWLNATSQHNPEHALTATEVYLDYVSHCKPYLYDYKNSLTQLMTRLFSQAEEREESDHGAMLQRVVIAQDTLLSLGVDGIADWLKAAERA